MHDIWNPWHGCKKCSPGCDNCYMYFLDEWRDVRTPSGECRRTGNFKYPLSKNRKGEYKIKAGERIRVNMTSDTFIEDADPWRSEMWDIIRKRPDVLFWFITKRPERIESCLPDDWGDGWDNCSINVTCENQDKFDERIHYLIDLPAKHKGLCLAPLISDIDISEGLASECIEQVVTGGENYYTPRPCDYSWVKHISDVCREYRVNFCFFETGTNFWKDGIHYFIPDKHKQGIEAYFAGLNQHYYDVIYDLRYPDGSLVTDDAIYEKVYNLNHCLFCSNRSLCNGCSRCGNCGGNEVIVSADAISYAERIIIDRNKFNDPGCSHTPVSYDGFFNLAACYGF